MINTSDRIKNIVNVIENDTLVDVGTDHGFISILAVQSQRAKKVIACDLNEKPLKSCQENIKKHGLENQITTKLSDGLKSIECDYQSVTICGMGGLLVNNILSFDVQKTRKFKQLVLQPQSDYREVRELIYELGFYIKEEIYFIDNLSKNNKEDKYYIIFNCQNLKKDMPSEKELMFGININDDSKEIYINFTETNYRKAKKSYDNLIENAKTVVLDKKNYYEKYLKYCEEILDEIK